MGMSRLAMDDSAGALEEFQTCLSMQIDESARDAQITRPALVHYLKLTESKRVERPYRKWEIASV